jgi:hypothetical protein
MTISTKKNKAHNSNKYKNHVKKLKNTNAISLVTCGINKKTVCFHRDQVWSTIVPSYSNLTKESHIIIKSELGAHSTVYYDIYKENIVHC